MKPLITADELRKLARLPADLVDLYTPLLEAAMREYGITTKKRRCAFLAQLLHESSGLTRWQENLNYSAARLLTVFGKRFAGVTDAEAYAHRSEAIANRVYAKRGGNGNEASGDGWRFRGRGPIQLTLRNNYRKFADLVPGSMLEHDPNRAAQPEWAFRIAACFWRVNNCNELADRLTMRGDDADRQVLVQITRRINGGVNGLNERINLFRVAKQVLHTDDVAESTPPESAVPAPSPVPKPEPDVDLLDAAVTSPKARALLWPRVVKHGTALTVIFGTLLEHHRFAGTVILAVLIAGAGWLVYHNSKRVKALLLKVMQ